MVEQGSRTNASHGYGTCERTRVQETSDGTRG